MKSKAFIMLILSTIFGSTCFADELTNECQDEKILKLILRSNIVGVVESKTCTYIFNEIGAEIIRRNKNRLREYISMKGFELDLVEKLYEKNKKQVRLPFKTDKRHTRDYDRISLPVWDSECRIILVYFEMRSWGGVLFFKNESGTLERIGDVTFWMS